MKRVTRRPWAIVAVTLTAVAAGATAFKGCTRVKAKIVEKLTPTYVASGDPSDLTPTFSDHDASRERIAISLEKMAEGFPQITDIQFVPGTDDLAVILLKTGEAKWLSLRDRAQGTLFTEQVLTASEEGLLGLAFHPRFPDDGRFFTNAVVETRDGDATQIAEWAIAPGADLRTARPEKKRVLLEVAQPYPNHNAGQLAFGPDGFLYVGFGDGGFADDPHGHGQDLATYLGAMLRIDVDSQGDGRAYGIPRDNPFVGREKALPEIWAYGLRNPWRYSFDPAGRLVVADVGQNRWEEVAIVERGSNQGWKVREGRHCFAPKEGCATTGLVDPVYEYDRVDGQSITGGYVYTGARIPELRGKYVFGDFVSGRLWAIDLPERVDNSAPLAKASALGKWPLLPSTFGRDAAGELYVGDFGTGVLYRIAPATGPGGASGSPDTAQTP